MPQRQKLRTLRSFWVQRMGHYIGIDLGGTKTEVIVLDSQSQTLFRERQPSPQHDYHATLEAIADLVDKAERSLGFSHLPVGIGIPGTISRKTGCVKNANSTWLNGKPLGVDISQRLARPVKIMNDANCLAVSEAVDGAAKGHDLVFAAILGTGCGAGISHHQQPLLGPNGLAGEWGHNPQPFTTDAERNARPCYCGNYGCVETFLSGTGLELSYQLATGQHLKVPEIVAKAETGDEFATTVLENYHQQLANALGAIINILDPDIIVLGGGVSNLPSLYPYLHQQLSNTVFGKECDTPIVQALHGDSSGVRGAAWLNL